MVAAFPQWRRSPRTTQAGSTRIICPDPGRTFPRHRAARCVPSRRRAGWPTTSRQPSRPGFRIRRSSSTPGMALVDGVSVRTDDVSLRIIGKSQGPGQPATGAVEPRAASPAAVLRLCRPLVRLQDLQHGGKPAGGVAKLAIAQALGVGELKPLVEPITVLNQSRRHGRAECATGCGRSRAQLGVERRHYRCARSTSAARSRGPPANWRAAG